MEPRGGNVLNSSPLMSTTSPPAIYDVPFKGDLHEGSVSCLGLLS